MFKNYLKISFRNIRKYKGHSFINIVGLAVGMACCIIIMQQVRHELSYDSFHTKADRIYRLNVKANFTGESDLDTGVSSGPSAPAILAEFPEVENFTRVDFGYTPFYERDKKIQIEQALFVENSFFQLFDYQFLAGDRNTALKDAYTAVITEKLAHTLFGDEDPIGKTIRGKKEYQITGVLKNIPENSHLGFDMLLSMTEKIERNKDNINVWQSFQFRSYLLLKPNTDPKVLESKFPEFVEQNFKMLAAKIELYLQPLKDIHLHSMSIQYDFNKNKSDIAYVYIFASIAFIILLIACINFMNLSTARAVRRSTEVGVRKVVGAYRSQLLYQFIGESLIIATIALLVSIILIEITRPVFTALFGVVFSTNIFKDLMLLIIYTGIILVVGIFAGGYPAFVLSAFQPKETLKGFTSAGGKGENLRKFLVALQFVVAIILLTSVGIITRQMHYIQNKNLGYNNEQVLVSPMDGNIQRNFDTFREILLQNPAITGVTASEFDVDEILSRSVYRIEGDTKDTQRMATQMYVDYDFAPFYGLEFVEGRNFSREFPTDVGESGGYVINEALRDELGWKTAVGKKLGRIDPGSNRPDNLGTVIGVVKDFNFASLHDKIGPLYFYMDNKLLDNLSIRIQSNDVPKTLALIKQEWTKFAPSQPFNARFLDENFELMYRTEKRTDKIVRTFTMLAIFVTCLGLLGLISFTAERRTKEIGIRKTLGATTRSIIVLLTKEIGWLVIIANLVAWPIAWFAMNKWLENFAYRIEMSWWMFALAGGLALVIALATVSWQAIRAATANPVKALRYE